MKTKKVGFIIGCGIFCILLILTSVWYAVTFNGSRLVIPMDFSNYTFHPKDLPMLVSITFACIYIFTLFALLLWNICRKQRQAETAATTRTLNPKLGFLGLLGFLGFVGFWTYSIDGSVFPFLFFIFFGFFGFYYEGKMSGTFMDERFRENAANAQLKAYKITLSILFIALIFLCQGKLFKNLEYTLISVIIVFSLAMALGIFLSEYLLYRYDHDEQDAESED